ncbi:hypothetical protein Abr02nite_23210 [Paractinoplanes brasiliensis]|nr:hypothetical protein Abr02nite_23210 [Actinoplanes brasiliensis]
MAEVLRRAFTRVNRGPRVLPVLAVQNVIFTASNDGAVDGLGERFPGVSGPGAGARARGRAGVCVCGLRRGQGRARARAGVTVSRECFGVAGEEVAESCARKSGGGCRGVAGGSDHSAETES